MKLTNKLGFPEAIVNAIKNDKYSRGDAQFSVTELLKPARAKALEERHRDEIEEDVSIKLWALFGQSIHTILERGASPKDLVEKRFFADFDIDSKPIKISGQIDLLSEDGTLSDWKVTKTYPFTAKGGYGQKFEWIAQLSMQLELLRQNGLDAKKVQIIGILKDYDQRCRDPKNKRFTAGYPKSEVVMVQMPVWDREKTQNFIRARIRSHVNAKETLPWCAPDETWFGRRCAQYCAPAPFCDQYKTALKTGRLTNDEGAIDAFSKERDPGQQPIF